MSTNTKQLTQRIAVVKYFDGENHHHNKALSIKNGVITAIEDLQEGEAINGEEFIVPGFIDIQVNGGGGFILNKIKTLEELKKMFQAHARFGSTAILPTLITDELTVMSSAADIIAAAIRCKTPGIIGVHFEGPHLSVAKKGAHSQSFIRPISSEEWQILERKDLGQIIVTLAPEMVSATDITRMVNLGIKVCLGHSNADYATAQKAVDAGASGFTHLYNAMSPLQGREPGMTGCALLNDNTFCGIIVDGHHVDYASCRLALKAKPAGKVLLVTDAMPPVGTDQQSFDFFDRQVFLNDGKLTSSTGELAGSVLTMAQAVKNTIKHLAVPQAEALRMASLYPAQFLGLQNKGQITVGADADFIVLSELGDVKQTWIAGQRVL